MTGRSGHVMLLRHLHAVPQPFHMEADAGLRLTLAQRFDLESIACLVADIELWREGGGVELAGEFTADAVQKCAISGQPVAAHVAGSIRLRFEPEVRHKPEDVDLDSEMLDVLPLEGDTLDLAEAVAQSFYLALDPYPRADAETLRQYRRYLLSEQEAARQQQEAQRQSGPFAGLRGIAGSSDSDSCR